MPQTVQLKEPRAPYNVTIDTASVESEPLILTHGDEPVLAVVSYREYREFAEWRERRQAKSAQAEALERERRAFQQMLPILLNSHRDQFVAFKDGQLIDSDSDESKLVMRLYQGLGYVPLYIAPVRETERVYRIPGPRVAR